MKGEKATLIGTLYADNGLTFQCEKEIDAPKKEAAAIQQIIPLICPRCTAPLNGNKCEHCGTAVVYAGTTKIPADIVATSGDFQATSGDFQSLCERLVKIGASYGISTTLPDEQVERGERGDAT